MTVNQIPERLVNYKVYNEKNDLFGVATVELPEVAFMSETVSGAGIAGEVESPTLGHTEAMSMSISWRTIEKAAIELATQEAHKLEIRGSQQVFDAGRGVYETVAVRVSATVVPKTFSLGSFEPGATTDTEQEFEVLVLRVYVGGKELFHHDKFNFVTKINGKDAFESVRKDLGM